MNRFFIIIGLIIAAALIAIFGFDLVKKEEPIVEAAEVDIVLEVVTGSVVLIDVQGKEQTITQGITEVGEGDIVKTQADTLAILYFSDDTLMRIDENTEVKVELYERQADSLRTGVWLTLGRVWSRVERIIEADSLYEVRTSNTVAAVRGTSFGVIRTETETEVVVIKKVVEVQAVDLVTRQPLPGGFIKVGEQERTRIIDVELPSIEKPLQIEKLSPEELEEKWLKFNLEENEVSLKESKIEEKRKALEEKKQQISQTEQVGTEQEIFIPEKPAWQQPKLLERLEAMKTETKTEVQKEIVEPEKPKIIKEISPLEKRELIIKSIEPREGVGDGYNDYLSIEIFGSGFEGMKSIFLGQVALKDIKIISDNHISAKIPGTIRYGIYNLMMIREDDVQASLSNAFEALKPIGW